MLNEIIRSYVRPSVNNKAWQNLTKLSQVDNA